MGGQIDRAVGRVKEATGVLTGNKDLQRRGRAEQVAAEASMSIDKGTSQVKKAVDEGSVEASKWINQGAASVEQAVAQGGAALKKWVNGK